MDDAKDISLLRTPIWEGDDKSQIAEPSAGIEGGRRSCSEASWPDGEETPESAEGRGGFSNTPHSSPKINTCIDYLKFRFDEGYEDNPTFFERLFEVLKVDRETYSKGGIYNNYLKHLQLDVGTILAYGGTLTINSEGRPTTLLELKGRACRDYEDRRFLLDPDGQKKGWNKAIQGYWKELIELCSLEMNGTCTRVDLPTDCLDGYIKVDEIREKVKERAYTTSMRRLELTDDQEAPTVETGQNKSLTGVATIRDSKLSGYTATFGTRKSVQLCIYDKAAEQKLKSGISDYDEWVRFEVRYYHDVADREMLPLLKALGEGKIEKHILSCLATAIEFKEDGRKDAKHRSEAMRWSKWDTFLRGTLKGESFSNVKGNCGVESNLKWLIKEAAKSFARVSIAFDVSPIELSRDLAQHGAMLLDKADFQLINEYRSKEGLSKVKDQSEFLGRCIDQETGEIVFSTRLRKYFGSNGNKYGGSNAKEASRMGSRKEENAE